MLGYDRMTSSFNQQTSGQAPPDSVEACHGQLTAPIAFISYALCCLTFIAIVTRVNNYWEMSRTHGDNGAYLTIAQATVEGRFSGADLEAVRKFYRGTGYCIALASLLTGVSVARCVPVLGLVCGALSIYFCGRLWGWPVAALFSFIGVEYTNQVCEGSCEPFFVLFLFVSLWLWRRQHPLSAFMFAALATTVRPTGVFLLLAFAAVLILHRRWRDLCMAAIAVSALGALYLAPLAYLAKDPWAPVNGYASDWYGALPITVPFYPLLRSALASPAPWTNNVKICFYILLTVFGLMTLWKRRHEAFANSEGQAEWIFYLLFAGFCVSYNSAWAYTGYPRFSAPIIPQSVLGIRSRFLTAWVILPMSVMAGFLSAVSALNLHTVLHMFMR
jgi:hypothetical protein